VRVSIVVGLALLLAAVVLRRATINRHIRGRLSVSGALFAIYVLAAMSLAWVPLAPTTYGQIEGVIPLLLAFGAINLFVALSINPWGLDRLPDRFPNIVQDALVIALFAVAATLILRERIVTTTAVGAVVIGFALQDTLGNLFAGLAIQVEKPFRVGDWVTISAQDGLVSEITWRATKMRTKAGNLVVVPNSVLAKDTITNYSEPTRQQRIHVEVGASYDTPPNVVKAVIHDALRDATEISHERATEVLLVDFAASAITYRVRFWIGDFEADERVKDRVRSLIYYAFRRHGITIPYPIQVQLTQAEASLPAPAAAVDAELLFSVPMFSMLSEQERGEILKVARTVLYSAREVIVRQDDAGGSLFVIRRGDAAVTLAGTAGQVAQLHAGDMFGEMSLLTGAPRNATVSAVTDCELFEIDAEGFRRVVLANPTVLDRVTAAAATRREELERHRDAHALAPAPTESAQSLLARVKSFLRL
jgi:small-conductance mechanosensitive channel/CRP-like cAMP-binding protein